MYNKIVVTVPPGSGLGIEIVDSKINQVRNIIYAVKDDSPLARRGLTPGDQIVSINGAKVHQMSAAGKVLDA